MRAVTFCASALLSFSFLAATALADDAPQLSLPLVCEPHKTCFIQNYVDDDPTVAERDFACGSATYEGHKGVDFRVLSAQAARDGVAVVASADGKVKAVREGMPDQFVTSDTVGDLQGRECGNGVVLDHGNGWETQYCHMQKGSVAVSRGQQVKRGEKLGLVGFSGLVNFPHVHLQVRHNNEIIDPFAPEAPSGACELNHKTQGLWLPDAISSFSYRNGEIMDWGFTQVIPTRDQLEENHKSAPPITAESPAFIFYARFLNLLAGDRIRIIIEGPGGTLVEQLSRPLDSNRHRHLDYAGKKRRNLPWQQGRYHARAEIVRDGAVVAATVAEMNLAAVSAQPVTRKP